MRVPPRWVRRIVGPLVVLVCWVLVLVALPVLAVAAAIASIWLPGRWRGLRLLGFALVGLTLELAALAAALVLWVAGGSRWRTHGGRSRAAHYRVLRWLLVCLVATARRLFALRVRTDGISWSPLDDGVPGSTNAMIVLCRHAGPGDSLLLMETLLDRDHLRHPRVVLKDTMALDPVVDVYLHRLPARFIDPAGGDVEHTIGDLAEGMAQEDALLIFPEGGNYTPKRRARSIARLRERGHVNSAERAELMRHVLPPRPGGVLAAMDAAPHADLIFVAHTGLEHLNSVRDVWHALPDHKTLELRWWFVSATDVPTGRQARIDWLFERWADIDAWIAQHRGPAEAASAER